MIYFGETNDFNVRLSPLEKHERWEDCIKRKNPTHIGILVESKEDKRLFIEEDLIKNHLNLCNKQHNL